MQDSHFPMLPAALGLFSCRYVVSWFFTIISPTYFYSFDYFCFATSLLYFYCLFPLDQLLLLWFIFLRFELTDWMNEWLSVLLTWTKRPVQASPHCTTQHVVVALDHWVTALTTGHLIISRSRWPQVFLSLISAVVVSWIILAPCQSSEP